MSDEIEMIYFRTEPTLEGDGYMITIDFGEDHTVALNRDEALAYAADVIMAVARAEYDAAVLRQMKDKVQDLKAAVDFIQDLRLDRPPLTNLGPLGLEPSVAIDNDDDGMRFRPFIALLFQGEKIGQWDAGDARGHAMGLLEVAAACDLDSAYLRQLVGMVGLKREVAEQVVGELAHYR